MAELIYGQNLDVIYKLTNEEVLLLENESMRKDIKRVATSCITEVPIGNCRYSRGYGDCADDVLNWLSMELDDVLRDDLGIR